MKQKYNSIRMFKNPILEFFSHIHPITPLVVWAPIVSYLMYLAIFQFHVAALTIAALFIAGAFFWTLAEYSLHRFVFHWMPPGVFGKKIHFIFHGVHHDYPSDSKRLVMVPTVSIPLAAGFFFLFKALVGPVNVFPFFIGFISGYLFYDMTHYALHHYNFKSKFWLNLKHHHMLHHFKDEHLGYGVSSKIWDYVFGTTFGAKKEEEKA